MAPRPRSAPEDLLIPMNNKKRKRNILKRSKTCIEDVIQNSSDEESDALNVVLNKRTLTEIIVSLEYEKSCYDSIEEIRNTQSGSIEVEEVVDQRNHRTNELEVVDVEESDDTHDVVEVHEIEEESDQESDTAGKDKEVTGESSSTSFLNDNSILKTSTDLSDSLADIPNDTIETGTTEVIESIESQSQDKENYPDTSQTLIPTQSSINFSTSIDPLKNPKNETDSKPIDITEPLHDNDTTNAKSTNDTIKKTTISTSHSYLKRGLSNSSLLNKPSPRYRVGLSKRANIESLHSYLQK